MRALVRQSTSARRLPAAVETASGDLADPASLSSALTGVDAVFLIWPFLTTEHAPAVLAAIGRHARRVVYVSSSGVDDDAARQTDPINQLHADMEALIERSGLEWTVLRANTIASNTLGWAEQIRATGVVRGPEIAATAVVHEGDIAAVAVRALTEDGHVAAKHVLTGPEVLSRADQVAAIGAADARRRPAARAGGGAVGQCGEPVPLGPGHRHGRGDHRDAGADVPRLGGRARR